MQRNVKLYFRGQPRSKVFSIGETSEIHTEPDGQITHSIDSNYHKGWLDNQQRTMIRTRSDQPYRQGDTSPIRTPKGGGHLPYVVGGLQEHQTPRNDGLSPCLPEAMGQGGGHTPVLLTNQIRRLTPIECERLQGFPDGWTSKGIDIKGKEVVISDTQRYKVLGNAVTTNVVEAIGRQFINVIE